MLTAGVEPQTDRSPRTRDTVKSSPIDKVLEEQQALLMDMHNRLEILVSRLSPVLSSALDDGKGTGPHAIGNCQLESALEQANANLRRSIVVVQDALDRIQL